MMNHHCGTSFSLTEDNILYCPSCHPTLEIVRKKFIQTNKECGYCKYGILHLRYEPPIGQVVFCRRCRRTWKLQNYSERGDEIK